MLIQFKDEYFEETVDIDILKDNMGKADWANYDEIISKKQGYIATAKQKSMVFRFG